jgi:hypothetical protein
MGFRHNPWFLWLNPQQSAGIHGHIAGSELREPFPMCLQIARFKRDRAAQRALLCKQEVAGSIPVGSIKSANLTDLQGVRGEHVVGRLPA